MSIKYLELLPFNVVQDPYVCCVDVVPMFRKYTVRITDAWGKTWYPRVAGRSRYEWTRSTVYARTWSKETALKHAEFIGRIASDCMNEMEDK